jgi:hypothetical protein
MKRSKSEPVKVEYISKTIWVSQELHIDLMFVEGDMFLISVTKPLGLTIINSINSQYNKLGLKSQYDALWFSRRQY